MEEIKKLLNEQSIQKISLVEKRPNIWRVIIPFFHEDGDMVEVFISPLGNSMYRISDFGMTLMRLSYYYDIDTPNKQKIFNLIISSYNIQIEKGTLFIDVEDSHIYPALLQFIGVVLKVCNMKIYKREIISSLFFEILDEFMQTKLSKFDLYKDFYPLEDLPEYKVDYCINHSKVPIFLFGVNNSSSARLTVISCLKFLLETIKFRSVVVLESLDCMGKNDQKRLLSVVDKVFPDYEEFEKNAEGYIERERKLLEL